MGSFNLSVSKMAKLDFYNPTVNFPKSSLASLESLQLASFLIGFQTPGDQYRFKNITSAVLHICYLPNGNNYFKSVYQILRADWIETDVTYNRHPELSYEYRRSGIFYGSTDQWDATAFGNTILDENAAIDLIKKGFSLRHDSGLPTDGAKAKFYTGNGGNAPYLEVNYDGDAYIEPLSGSPYSGYIPKHSANKFSWNTRKVGNCVGDLSVTNCKFYWRNGTSGDFTEVDRGTAMYYTLPADSISADTFQWYVQITDNSGHVSTGWTYTLSTSEVLSTASCVSPVNTMVDGSKPVNFSWNHIISTGTEQSAAELQYSSDGQTWISLANVSGSEKTVEIPSGTFSSGQKYWRVRTYNTDEAPGSWSDAASFLVVSAPPVPSVSSEQNSKPLISWQSSDQQGFQVRVSGIFDSGTVFGLDTSFRVPLYLADGSYSAEVRIQNAYGLWSEWGSSPINVAHVPGNPISLDAFDGMSISLSWSKDAAYTAGYIVYRDGTAIAKTNEGQFTDEFANGEHVYQVRGIYLDSPDYGISNEATAAASVEYLMITDVQNINWQALKYSSSSINDIRLTHTVKAITRHLTGSRFPSVALSPYEEMTISFNIAFMDDPDGIRSFEGLIGKTVCLKTKSGESIIGVLLSASKTESVFYTGFSCTLSQIELEEEIEI